MLPHAYQGPAAVLLILGGALACVAGYRLFRVVLGIYGFILGAMIGSSLMGATNTIGMVVAAIVGGMAGALILVFAYFVGVALVGAGLGALAVHAGWAQFGAGDPPAALVILLSIFGAISAMVLQRYVIVVGTAFAGAWTIIDGTVALVAARAVESSSSDVWIMYPMTPAPGQRWVPIAWVVLGIVGTIVQLGLTGRKR